MRTLTITRERALAAFGMKYHIFTGGSREEFLALLEKLPMEQRKNIQPDFSLNNGQTVRFQLPEDATATFFVALFTDSRNIVTNEVIVPPGQEDVHFIIKTLYDGYHQMNLSIVAAE